MHPWAGVTSPIAGWHCEGPGIGCPFFKILRVLPLGAFTAILLYIDNLITDKKDG